jgi:flagellar motor switch protein FliM
LAGPKSSDLQHKLGEPRADHNDEEIAAAWETMVDGQPNQRDNDPAVDRLLNQDEIDTLLGFSAADITPGRQTGIRAIVDSAMVSYERLPMLEIVFDRLVRLLTTSLRNFFSDTVEITLDGITSVRFGDYINSIPLPSILLVFKAQEWDNFGILSVDANLVYGVMAAQRDHQPWPHRWPSVHVHRNEHGAQAARSHSRRR